MLATMTNTTSSNPDAAEGFNKTTGLPVMRLSVDVTAAVPHNTAARLPTITCVI
jgi:hypothetical protein